jgi:hypothetical protein
MKLSDPFPLIQCISICRPLSFVSAAIHYCLISVRLLKAPIYILNNQQGVFKILIGIWGVRFVRRVISVFVRSPFRISTLRLINLTIPFPTDSGCIIAICHTPWKRLLVQWCLKNNFALIIGNGNWSHRRGRIQRQAQGFNDLRNLVRFLQQNGRVVITFDNFNKQKNCPVNFLGNCYNVSSLPARLAKIAKVPLITAIPTLHNGTIDIHFGPRFDSKNLDSRSNTVMQNLISFLETEIKNNPGIWPTTSYQSIL